jgi:hypothetical protein
MPKLSLIMVSAVLTLTWAVPTTSVAATESGTVGPGSFNRVNSRSALAFTLEEMNCFSSDIHALEPAETDPTQSEEAAGSRVASSTGTNGIPCDARDPKAPPKRKKSRS